MVRGKHRCQGGTQKSVRHWGGHLAGGKHIRQGKWQRGQQEGVWILCPPPLFSLPQSELETPQKVSGGYKGADSGGKQEVEGEQAAGDSNTRGLNRWSCIGTSGGSCGERHLGQAAGEQAQPWGQARE